jgi:hypothetical protein
MATQFTGNQNIRVLMSTHFSKLAWVLGTKPLSKGPTQAWPRGYSNTNTKVLAT